MQAFSEYFAWWGAAFITWMAFAVGVLVAIGPVKSKTDRQWTREFLENGAGKGLYRDVMQPILRRLDMRLSPSELQNNQGKKAIAWSANLATVTLLLAVFYPLAAFITQWVTGQPLRLGGAEIAPAGDPSARSAFAFILTASAIFYALSAMLKSRWRGVLFVTATAILVSIPFFAESLNIPGAFAVAIAVAGAVAGAGAVAVAFAFEVIENRTKPNAGLRFTPSIILQLILAIIILEHWTPESTTFTVYVVIFFGVLPFLNALFDFASYGLTRYFIARGLEGSIAANFLWDMLGAIVAFFGLGFAIITYITFIHPPSGPLIDLSIIFAQLQTERGSFGWLAFMMFSTFIPTVVHAVVFVMTSGIGQIILLRTLLLQSLSHANPNGSDSGFAAVGFYAILSTSAFLLVWIPWTLIKLISHMPHGDLLSSVISVFEGYAHLIGAI